MPAARSLQKRYTAGGCVLDVEWQLSALSQWYPKPVAQALRFKLWMNSGQDEASAAGSVLVAEGDHVALQEISHYTSQKVQGLLAIAHINSADRSAALQNSQQPPSLRLTRPLSYLQLCDLNSVLNQCEQATATLPTALSLAPSTPKANNVVPFLTLRRSIRRQPVAWASSAAAALLAVGLTTALWPGYQRPSYETSSLPNTDISGTTPEAATGAKPNSAADSIPPSALPSGVPSSNAPSGSIRSSQPAVKPNTDKTTIAEPSPSAAVSQAKPPVNPSVEPSDRSAAKLQAQAPTASPETATAPLASPRASGAPPETPSNQSQEFSAARSTRPRASSSVLEAAPPPAAESATARANRPNLSTAPGANTAANDGASTATDSASASSTADQAVSQPEAITIAQVQRYFQTKWQESGVPLSEPLSYSVQLSGKGEVVSFAALSSNAEAYRDRLLPQNAPLVFSVGSSSHSSSNQTSAGLALRLDILPNGQVRVTKI